MRTIQHNIDDWLRREAHVVTGYPFQVNDCSCVPVAPQTSSDTSETPVGFLVTHGQDISFIAAQTPECAQILGEWNKLHQQEIEKEEESLPAEYWYG